MERDFERICRWMDGFEYELRFAVVESRCSDLEACGWTQERKPEVSLR